MSTEAMSPAEWEIMRVVWTQGGAATGDVIAVMQAKRDWSDSTIKTLLRRLVTKQALTTEKIGRQFYYRPLISEQKAMQESAGEFFDHLCEMKQGKVLLGLLNQVPLSQGDILAMQKVLAARLETAPEQVACNCLASECTCRQEGMQ